MDGVQRDINGVAHSLCNWAFTNSFVGLLLTCFLVLLGRLGVKECITPCSLVSNWMNAY